MLAVIFSFPAVTGIVTPVGLASAASPIEIITYCSVVSMVASIVFFFGLLNVYSNPRTDGHLPGGIGESYVYAESNEIRQNREWRASQSRTVF